MTPSTSSDLWKAQAAQQNVHLQGDNRKEWLVNISQNPFTNPDQYLYVSPHNEDPVFQQYEHIYSFAESNNTSQIIPLLFCPYH